MTDQTPMTPEQVVNTLAPVIERVMGQRMEEVYGAIEAMREEFQQTISVMDGNDHAIIAELQKIKGMTPAEVLQQAGESWERFIVGEAKHLGLKVVRPKVASEPVPVERVEVRNGD